MLLKIKVFPGSKEEKVEKVSCDKFKVFVRQKPVLNMANQAMISALSGYFKVAESKIRITKGAKRQNKTVEISGIDKIFY